MRISIFKLQKSKFFLLSYFKITDLNFLYRFVYIKDGMVTPCNRIIFVLINFNKMIVHYTFERYLTVNLYERLTLAP
jgi:hypothetical protein